jgi:Fe-S-cluster containining protein
VTYETDLSVIAASAAGKDEENDHFIRYVQRQDGDMLDATAQAIYKDVNAAIDCTTCGNCCKTLVVNITPPEITRLSAFLNKPEAEVREQYIEESLQGACYLNSIPCHFLDGTKCGIYEERFTECRDFPHLHKPGFKQRLLGTLLHYGSCPIIYNTIELVKREIGFVEKA